jgi:nucleoside-diphosphate-sugar epimerase
MTAVVRIAITGANGFIGSRLSQSLSAQGATVMKWVRNPRAPDERRFSLPDVIDESLFQEKLDVLIHAAYVTRFRTLNEAHAANIDGSLKLFQLAEQYGVKIIFLSSFSAHPQAESFYGQSKLFLEQQLDLQKHLVIRSGLVLGNGGLFERMQKMARTFRCIPIFWGGQQPIQIIHVDDLVQAIGQLLFTEKTGSYTLATTQIYQLLDLYTEIFRQLQQKPRFIYFPGTLSLKILQLCEKLGMTLPISSENLLGLKHLRSFPVDCDKIGLVPLSLAEAVKRFS